MDGDGFSLHAVCRCNHRAISGIMPLWQQHLCKLLLPPSVIRGSPQQLLESRLSVHTCPSQVCPCRDPPKQHSDLR